jgi:membrane-bound metal-dependent hydrolase YbcI (DUF457 family)
MGRSHLIAGVIVGELVARAAGVHTVDGQALLAGVGAVGGLLPDIDCGSSTITRMLGPVGWVLSHALRAFSHALYAMTKGPRDERCEGEHRHASHTVLFAVLVGLLAVAACSVWPASLPVSPSLIGFGLAAGCVSHCLTDAMTVAGCPFLFPLPIAGETWYEIRLLGPFSFHTGSTVERCFWRPVFIVAAVLLVPGVSVTVLDSVHQVWTNRTPRAAPK